MKDYKVNVTSTQTFFIKAPSEEVAREVTLQAFGETPDWQDDFIEEAIALVEERDLQMEYKEYCEEFYEDHEEGMEPACFDEWYMNEGLENDG